MKTLSVTLRACSSLCDSRKRLTLLSVDGSGQESNEAYDGQQREESTDEEEELEALQPGPPVVLQVHNMSDQGPKSQHA